MRKKGKSTRLSVCCAKGWRSVAELWETLYYVWAEGYMTGFNMARASLQGKASDLNPYSRSEQWRRDRQIGELKRKLRSLGVEIPTPE